MFIYTQKLNNSFFYKAVTRSFVCILSVSLILSPSAGYAQTVNVLNLPVVGTMVPLSQPFSPAILSGIKIFPDNPLRFDFIVDTGDTGLEGDDLKKESEKLIKYFLASLTVPEKDLWVNLSPYEKDRIIPDEFGVTEMGRDLLAQDYILKQLTASLMYPEDELGEKFWNRIYKRAYEEYGTTEILPTSSESGLRPSDKRIGSVGAVNTFNKVWIVPQKAVVYENAQTNTAFVLESHLKVMLEEDYIAEQENRRGLIYQTKIHDQNTDVATNIIRDILIPEIEKEVNQGENFAKLRQIYNSLILASWFKTNLQQHLLRNVYIDQNKIEGVDIEDKQAKDKIYQQYLEAFKTGVYNYIKEDYDPVTEEIIPRKYFSGGFTALNLNSGSSPILQVLTEDFKVPQELRNRIAVNDANYTLSTLLKPEGEGSDGVALTEIIKKIEQSAEVLTKYTDSDTARALASSSVFQEEDFRRAMVEGRVVRLEEYYLEGYEFANKLDQQLRERKEVYFTQGKNRYKVDESLIAGIARSVYKVRRITESGYIMSPTIIKIFDQLFIDQFGVDYSQIFKFFSSIERDDKAKKYFAVPTVESMQSKNFDLYQMLEMEYVPGKSLLKQSKELSREDRLKIIMKLAEGLAYIQKTYKAFHGDIGAQNILLDDSMNPKLIDWDFIKMSFDKRSIDALNITMKYKDIADVGFMLLNIFTKDGVASVSKIFHGNAMFSLTAVDIENWHGTTKLENIQDVPQGMLKIIKKAVLADDHDNYESMGELHRALVKELGENKFSEFLKLSDQDTSQATSSPISREALTSSEIDTLQKLNPQWDIQKSSIVEWEELVRVLIYEKEPHYNWQKNYFNNQIEVRAEFIKLLFDLKEGEIKEVDEFKQRMIRLHEIYLVGGDGKSLYDPMWKKRQDMPINSDIRDSILEKYYKFAGFPEETKKHLSNILINFQNFVKENRNLTLEDVVQNVLKFYESTIGDLDRPLENDHIYLFDHGNNGMFMNMVNAMLRLYGLNGIPHEYFDYEVVETFRGHELESDLSKGFFDIVQQANPQVEEGDWKKEIKVMKGAFSPILDDLMNRIDLNLDNEETPASPVSSMKKVKELGGGEQNLVGGPDLNPAANIVPIRDDQNGFPLEREKYLKHVGIGKFPSELEKFKHSFPWPFSMKDPSNHISNYFGVTHFQSPDNPNDIHQGVDLQTQPETEIAAVEDGVVVKVDTFDDNERWPDQAKRFVDIQIFSPESNLLWTYVHVDRSSVPERIIQQTLLDRYSEIEVKTGEFIGKVSKWHKENALDENVDIPKEVQKVYNRTHNHLHLEVAYIPRGIYGLPWEKENYNINSLQLLKPLYDLNNFVANSPLEKVTNKWKKGGIDLNPAQLNIEMKGTSIEFDLPFDIRELEGLLITGFTPIIFHIAPVINLPLLLGFENERDSGEDINLSLRGFDYADHKKRFVLAVNIGKVYFSIFKLVLNFEKPNL